MPRSTDRVSSIEIVRAPSPYRWAALYVDGIIDHQMHEITAESALCALAKLPARPFTFASGETTRRAADVYLGEDGTGFPRKLSDLRSDER